MSSGSSSRRVSSVPCPRCRAENRVDAEAVLRALAGGEAVRCRSCRRSFVPSSGASSGLSWRSGSRAAERGSGTGTPPFPSLGASTGEPPPFAPRTPEPVAQPRTLIDRWNGLSAGRQKLAVGAVLGAIAAGVLAWPAAAVRLPPPPEAKPDYPPRPEEPRAVVVEKIVEVPKTVEVIKEVEAPKPEERTYFLAVAAVPEDTRITEENFGKLFEPHRAITLPPGAVGSKADALGWYVQRPLGTGTLLTHGLLGANRVPKAAPVAVAPMPREYQEPGPETRVVRTHTERGTRYSFLERQPGAGWVLVRETFVPAAGAEVNFPPGGDSK